MDDDDDDDDDVDVVDDVDDDDDDVGVDYAVGGVFNVDDTAVVWTEVE